MAKPEAVIAKGRARPFWFGCPVVFSGSVARVNGNPAAGDLVNVTDDRGQLIGRGFYNPASSYRVRIVAKAGDPSDDADALIRGRILRAVGLRSLLGLPSPQSNVYRLFNSEGDGLSGLTIDMFGNNAVVMESAFWVSGFRPVISAAVREALGKDVCVMFRVASSVRKLEGITVGDEGEPVDAEITVVENGIHYLTRPGSGQKTGYYADQRDNRADIARYAVGARVLDLFCFSGGFAMNAASAGARAVTAVDSSADAIESGRQNASLNGLAEQIEFRRSDVMEFLKYSGEYDLVVCDPPKLAAGRSSLDSGMKHYSRLNTAALATVAEGGIFVTCSCSSVVRRDPFISMVRDAATVAGREVTLLSIRGAGPDHPINPAWTEGEYLKVLTMAVSKTARA